MSALNQMILALVNAHIDYEFTYSNRFLFYSLIIHNADYDFLNEDEKLKERPYMTFLFKNDGSPMPSKDVFKDE